LLADYPVKSAIITAEYCFELTNWSSAWSPNVEASFRKESRLLPASHQKCSDLHVEIMKHHNSDHYLFPNFKARKFSSTGEATVFAAQRK
jgi:hypothetical protein